MDMLFWDARKPRKTRGIRFFGKSVCRDMLLWKTRIQGYAFLEKAYPGIRFSGMLENLGKHEGYAFLEKAYPGICFFGKSVSRDMLF